MAAIAIIPAEQPPVEPEENRLLPNDHDDMEDSDTPSEPTSTARTALSRLQSNIKASRTAVCIVLSLACFAIIAAAILTYISLILFVFDGNIFDHKSQNLKQSECYSSCCVYCDGEMLITIQEYDFFNDSKYFVDMPMHIDPDKILLLWQQRIVNKGLIDDKDAVYNFLMTYFDAAGSDVTDCIPIDFYTGTDSQYIPSELESKIMDDKLKEFASGIYKLWQYLCKNIDDSVYSHPLRHSLLPLKYPQMIVAGGRFREVYYWDTFWIMQGLLVSDMTVSAKMTLSNLMNLTSTYGHMLNGNRVYYQNRSQPPLLTFMMDLIYEFEQDDSYIIDNIEYLDILKDEYFWWMNGQSIDVSKYGNVYTLNRYYIDSDKPRPEELKNDMYTVSMLPNKSALSIRHAYSSIRSVAESGWDLSSRFCLHLYCELDVTNIDTTNVIPVELNAYLYHVETTLSKFFGIVNAAEDVEYFTNAANARLDAIYNVFWDEDNKKWNDYDIRNDVQIVDEHTISSYVPLWLLPYNESTGIDVLTSLNNSGLLYIGGVATTDVDDEQQWDFPNAWPPLQWILVQMAKKYNNTDIGEYILHNVTQTYINAAYIGYNHTHYLAEKYNVLHVGQYGDGGEYPVQIGFGWSNGVALSFLYDYGDFLVAPSFT